MIPLPHQVANTNTCCLFLCNPPSNLASSGPWPGNSAIPLRPSRRSTQLLAVGAPNSLGLTPKTHACFTSKHSAKFPSSPRIYRRDQSLRRATGKTLLGILHKYRACDRACIQKRRQPVLALFDDTVFVLEKKEARAVHC